MMSEYMKKRQGLKNGTVINASKEKKEIPKKSEKKIAQEKEEKQARGDDDTQLQKWFNARRKQLVGVCQCGCARKSSKFDDLHFRSSCCHIFPKAHFESIMYHPLNFVERNYWDGCHGNMDNKSMSLWPMFADWDDIKAKFHELAALLTDEERAHKFYGMLEELVYKN